MNLVDILRDLKVRGFHRVASTVSCPRNGNLASRFLYNRSKSSSQPRSIPIVAVYSAEIQR